MISAHQMLIPFVPLACSAFLLLLSFLTRLLARILWPAAHADWLLYKSGRWLILLERHRLEMHPFLVEMRVV